MSGAFGGGFNTGFARFMGPVTPANRRMSVQAYTLGLMRPPPSGSVSMGDRATVAWLYSGLDYFPAGTDFCRFHKWFFMSGQFAI